MFLISVKVQAAYKFIRRGKKTSQFNFPTTGLITGSQSTILSLKPIFLKGWCMQSSGFTTDFIPIAGLLCHYKLIEEGRLGMLTGTRQVFKGKKIKHLWLNLLIKFALPKKLWEGQGWKHRGTALSFPFPWLMSKYLGCNRKPLKWGHKGGKENSTLPTLPTRASTPLKVSHYPFNKSKNDYTLVS